MPRRQFVQNEIDFNLVCCFFDSHCWVSSREITEVDHIQKFCDHLSTCADRIHSEAKKELLTLPAALKTLKKMKVFTYKDHDFC